MKKALVLFLLCGTTSFMSCEKTEINNDSDVRKYSKNDMMNSTLVVGTVDGSGNPTLVLNQTCAKAAFKIDIENSHSGTWTVNTVTISRYVNRYYLEATAVNASGATIKVALDLVLDGIELLPNVSDGEKNTCDGSLQLCTCCDFTKDSSGKITGCQCTCEQRSCVHIRTQDTGDLVDDLGGC